MSLTTIQQQAVAAQGNVLLMAGAGTGKTRTLVERCLNCLLDRKPPCDLSEILVVTFTEAAAAEMRHRLRARLQERAEASARETRAGQQLVLFETAHIGTLHSFCLELVRRHFYLLELDPQFSVMSEEESRLLAAEQLDALFADMYSGKTPLAAAVRELIGTHGDGSDQTIRALVLRLHDYAQTLPNPEGWKESQLRVFSEREPLLWREWLGLATAEFKREWAPFLESLAATNGIAKECLSILNEISEKDLAAACAMLSTVRAAREACPRGKKGAWVDPLKEFFSDAQFLCSVLPPAKGKDPLAEDWSWVSGQMQTLLQLSSEFTARFSRAKRDLALADFHDLEQFALRLLWDPKTNSPTNIAQQWRKAFHHVLVDEYQDINAAQDQILQALSRDGRDGNRFLVGDLKQSIYRFRLAAPRIFQSYLREWRKGAGTVIPLNENFRSREGILDFINSVFEMLMTEEVGGIAYDKDARLGFGAPAERKQLAKSRDDSRRVEFHLLLKAGRNGNNGDAPELDDSIAELEQAAKEARLLGIRLAELHASRHPVWDDELKDFRPVDWKDMAILLRSRSRKTEFYVREFSRLQIPLAAARGNFFESTEISDVLSLLAILDNPLQDLAVLAVLRSPIVGLSLEELAELRLAADGPFWVALRKWHEHPRDEKDAANTAMRSKVARFIERFAKWRTFARQMSLSSCLEEILAETCYPEWLLTQSRGEERFANLQGLINLARKFDRFQRQGLLRFLLFVEAQKSAEAEPPVPTVIDENAVRLMSIHQSKGLEFPVVALADAAKNFNLIDLKADIILDEVYGICPLIKPPHTSKRYPSLPYWLGRKRQRNELLGEELRLLYVAMTRARDTLLITASLSEKQVESIWSPEQETAPNQIADARSFMDWLRLWLQRHAAERAPDSTSGECNFARWTIHEESSLASSGSANESDKIAAAPDFLSDAAHLRKIEAKLAWIYPFSQAVRQPAKASVSTLRRAAMLEESESDASTDLLPRPARLPAKKAADAGTATHAFMQGVSLECVGSEAQLRLQADRLVSQGIIRKADVALIEFEKVAAFWQSSLGRAALDKNTTVHRELPFTAKFSMQELSDLLGTPASVAEAGEFVIVQGIADLVLMSADSLQIIDFKTDHVFGEAVAERAKTYEPQVRLYALALSRIYKQPVTGCWLYFLGAGAAVEVTR